MIMPFHTCSGAECPKCGVFARQPAQPLAMQRSRCDLCQQDTMPGIRTCWTCKRRMCHTCAPHVPDDQYLLAAQVMCGECFASQHRRHAFVDSRGLPVERMPTSVVPGTTIILPHGTYWRQDTVWTVLIHKRADNLHWGFPGGAMQAGESLLDCAKRETLEETGLDIYLQECVCIDSDPTTGALCLYNDETTCIQYCNVTFVGGIITGVVKPSAESLDIQWCRTDALPSPFLPTHQWRLAMAMQHPRGPFPVR